MAYLTVESYVTRFGAYEARLFTNTDPENQIPAGQYNSAAIQAQLDDATDLVEAYISRRYSVPLASPPTIVMGWVAALARLKLAGATGRVNDAIKDAADFAVRQLEQLAASKLDLPIAEGEAPLPEHGLGSPLSSGDATPSAFGGCALNGYLEPFGCQPRVSEWRRLSQW